MILDTNALSAFFDGEPAVVALLGEQPDLYLPVIVMGEYQFGLRASRLKKARESQLLAFARACTVLPVLESTVSCYAAIRDSLRRAGTPIPENDVWISALALEYQLPVLTRDQHFLKVKQIKTQSW